MKKANITPVNVVAAATTKAPITAEQMGGQRPPVTTAVRWGASAVDAILKFAKSHSNEATKAHFGCSAHYVGALRKKHGLANYVAPKATAPKATSAKAPATKGGKRPAFAKDSVM